MFDPTATDLPRLGAIVYDGDLEIEPVLAAVRDRLLGRAGFRLGGVVPRDGAPLANGRNEMLLDDVISGAAISISQKLGAGADSCILDIDGLTRARLAIVAAVESGVDLVMVGKFAKQEAAGHGVREEIGAALVADVPTLVALRETQLAAWRDFAGDDWQRLPPEVTAIVAWVEAVTASG